jgi:hypothetical protein
MRKWIDTKLRIEDIEAREETGDELADAKRY